MSASARDRNATTAPGLGDTCAMPPKRISVAAVEAPWGPVHVAVSERGVVALDTLSPGDAFVAALERRFHAEIDTGSSPLLERAVRQLEEYLRGERRAFTLRVDLADRPAWDRLVLDAVRQIPWGETRSYGMLARHVDRPGAARAVGGAVGRSPIGIVVPCHRVIAGDGTLGGYGGDGLGSYERGLELKQELLAMEGVDVRRRRD
jgi:methylated-DNA-[protein]-cysteine S-methyltransferase